MQPTRTARETSIVLNARLTKTKGGPSIVTVGMGWLDREIVMKSVVAVAPTNPFRVGRVTSSPTTSSLTPRRSLEDRVKNGVLPAKSSSAWIA
jgi:hypothetical protein